MVTCYLTDARFGTRITLIATNTPPLMEVLYFYQTILEHLDISDLADKPVIIKGNSHKPVPENAYIMAVSKIQQVAKSVMYGEACSSVPLYKKR